MGPRPRPARARQCSPQCPWSESTPASAAPSDGVGTMQSDTAPGIPPLLGAHLPLIPIQCFGQRGLLRLGAGNKATSRHVAFNRGCPCFGVSLGVAGRVLWPVVTPAHGRFPVAGAVAAESGHDSIVGKMQGSPNFRFAANALSQHRLNYA